MKLSQARAIMDKFKLKANGLVDPDLFDIFLQKGSCRPCAEQFMDSWQIDQVNL